MALRDELRMVVGEDAAARLIAEFGGTLLYVPVTAAELSPIAQAIGLEPARKLSCRFGGERIDVPNPSARRQRIIELHTSGMSARDIARKLGVTRRWVHEVISQLSAPRAASS